MFCLFCVIYTLQATAEHNGKSFELDWSRERVFDSDVTTLLLNRVKASRQFVVEDLVIKEGQKDKPCALNTVELLRVCSSSLGISPANAMSVAEHLYTRGYISYPRTETTSYPAGCDFISTVKQQLNGQFGSVAQKILSEGVVKPKGGQDKGDHPPITPMKANDGALSGGELQYFAYYL